MKYPIESALLHCYPEEVEAYRSCGFTPLPETPGRHQMFKIDGDPPAMLEAETIADLIAASKRLGHPIIVDESGTLEVYNDHLE